MSSKIFASLVVRVIGIVSEHRTISIISAALVFERNAQRNDRKHSPQHDHRQRWHRELLRTALEREGFKIYEWEWWHFDYQGWKEWPIGVKTFEELEK